MLTNHGRCSSMTNSTTVYRLLCHFIILLIWHVYYTHHTMQITAAHSSLALAALNAAREISWQNCSLKSSKIAAVADNLMHGLAHGPSVWHWPCIASAMQMTQVKVNITVLVGIHWNNAQWQNVGKLVKEISVPCSLTHKMKKIQNIYTTVQRVCLKYISTETAHRHL